MVLEPLVDVIHKRLAADDTAIDKVPRPIPEPVNFVELVAACLLFIDIRDVSFLVYEQ